MSSLRLIRTAPGATNLGPIVRNFCRGEGIVTALSDSALPLLKRFVEEDDAVEVLAFGELTMRILTLCGEDALPLAQAGHLQAAIAKACGDLPDESPFSRTARFVGMHQALGRTLKELHEWGIDRDEMLRLADMATPRLASKLKSIAQVDEGVTEVFALLGRQGHAEQVRACLECTPERDGGFERLFVFVGSEECPLRLRWLRWVAENGTEVTVVVDRHAGDAPLFPGSRRAEERLHSKGTSVGEGNRLMMNLFSVEEKGGALIEVEIVSAADPLAEAEWALRRCVQEDRPDLSGIYVRDLEGYAPLIEAAAKRLEVPVRISRRAPLLTNSFARLTLTALEFCASSDVRSLRPILQSSYLGLTGEQQAEIASALRDAHSMRALQWDTLRMWADGKEAEYGWVAALLDWRRKAAGSLPLREWMSLLTELIRADDRLPWSVTIQRNEGKMADRDRRARNQLERILANHLSVAALEEERSMNLPEAVEMCRRLWKDADVSIPSADIGVCVSDSPEALAEVETLVVMGMLEGVFPRRRSEEPILTDFEREEISHLRSGEPRLLTSHDRAEAERDAFYRVCAAARKRLVFSYPMADDQRDNIPAFYLTEIERAMGGAVAKLNRPRTLFAPQEADSACAADRRLREALDAARTVPSPVELVSEAARKALRPEEGHRFEPRELRDVLQCPFQYALRHRLHVRVRRSGARWQSLRQLPIAAGLIGQATREAAERAMVMALDAELDRLYSDVPEWEMQLLRSGGRRLIREWLRREFRARETWPKEEGSVAQNVAFGDPGLRDGMPGNVGLSGTVPAISKLQRYNVAHLYGSGVRDPKNLTETEKLYLGLYFLALHESGREGALEIESMRGKRELLILTRAGGPVNGHVQDGLSVVDLATADDPALSKKLFFEDVKRALRRAVERVYDARIDPMKGDWCDWCDYGELCRRSRAFGEEDSPFGPDMVFEND